MNINIKDNWALITGGAIGIGAEIAKDIAKTGANIVITYRKSKKDANNLVLNLEKKYNVKALAYKLDSTIEKDVNNFFKEFYKEGIIFNILINNVGDYLYKNILDTTYSEWSYIIKNNLDATFIMISEFLKYREDIKWGRIISIGYMNSGAKRATPNITPYYIAKSGIYYLTLSLAKELADKNITVNMISPGVMENSVNIGKKLPIYRHGKLSELSSAVLYLLSDNTNYLTGSQIDISGGFGF